MSAAAFVTAVPVMPMAMPMSAFLMAGASFTPSPVIATMWPCSRRTSTRWTLSWGETRPMTPMPSTSRSTASWSSASNSAPVMALPGMPSCVATTAPVTAASPVIMRTWTPAPWASAMAAFAAGRGGSVMPTSARSVRPSIAFRRSAFGSNVAASKSFWPVAMRRMPSLPIRSLSAR